MNIKQSLMLIISIALCLAIYPFYSISIAVLLLLTSTTAAMVMMGKSRTGLIPVGISLIGALIFCLVFGIEYTLPGIMAAVAALSGYAMGVAVKSRWNLQGILIFGSGVFVIAIVGWIFAVNSIYNIDIINNIIQSFKELAYDAVVMLGMVNSGTKGEFKDMINLAYDYITTLVPSILIITCAGMAYISFGFTRYILKKNKILLPMLPDRRHLIMSKGSGWILVLCWVLNIFITDDRIRYALSNISIIISTLFFVCGISLVLYLIEYKVKPAGVRWLLRIIMLISLFSIGSALISELFVMAAIIDSVWDFRKTAPIVKQ